MRRWGQWWGHWGTSEIISSSSSSSSLNRIVFSRSFPPPHITFLSKQKKTKQNTPLQHLPDPSPFQRTKSSLQKKKKRENEKHRPWLLLNVFDLFKNACFRGFWEGGLRNGRKILRVGCAAACWKHFPGNAVTHRIHYSCYSNTWGEASTFGTAKRVRSCGAHILKFPKMYTWAVSQVQRFDGEKKWHTNILTYKADQPCKSTLFVLIYLHVPGPDEKWLLPIFVHFSCQVLDRKLVWIPLPPLHVWDWFGQMTWMKLLLTLSTR